MRVIDWLVWAAIVTLSATRRPGPKRKGRYVRARHIIVLAATTWAFVVCFAVWLMFGVIGIPIRRELGLNAFEFGLPTATPILTGALLSG